MRQKKSIADREMQKKKSARTRASGPIVWAVDPVEHDFKRLKPLIKAIDLWRGNSRIPIHPVSVLSPLDLKWPLEIGAPIGEEMIRLASGFIEPAVQNLFSQKKTKVQIPLQILLQRKPSLRETASALIRYSKTHRAQMIAMFTHGRRGLDRFSLGSFAEIILTQSRMPVLTVNPKAKVSDRLRTIAFPTDFSRHSNRAFKKVVRFAKQRQVKIQLLHVFNFATDSFPPIFETLTTTAAIVDHAWAKAELNQRREGEKWVQLARDEGVDAELIFSAKPGIVGEKVVQLSRDCKADFIVMSIAHTPLSMSFLGGTVRTILGLSECPVILLPTK